MSYFIVVGLLFVICSHTEAAVSESTNELTPVNETEAEVRSFNTCPARALTKREFQAYLQKFGYWKPEEREESTPRAHASTRSEPNRTWPTRSRTDAIK